MDENVFFPLDYLLLVFFPVRNVKDVKDNKKLFYFSS